MHQLFVQHLCEEPLKEACKSIEQNIADHFVHYHEMVRIESGAERIFDDGIKLSRSY